MKGAGGGMGNRADQKVRMLSDLTTATHEDIKRLMSVAAIPEVDEVAALPGFHDDGDGLSGAAVLSARPLSVLLEGRAAHGAALYLTDIPVTALSREKAVAALRGIADRWDMEVRDILRQAGFKIDAGALRSSVRCDLLRQNKGAALPFFSLSGGRLFIRMEGDARIPGAWLRETGIAGDIFARLARAQKLGREIRAFMTRRVAEALGTRAMMVCDVALYDLRQCQDGYLHILNAGAAEGVLTLRVGEDGKRYAVTAGEKVDEAFRAIPGCVLTQERFEELVEGQYVKIAAQYDLVTTSKLEIGGDAG